MNCKPVVRAIKTVLLHQCGAVVYTDNTALHNCQYLDTTAITTQLHNCGSVLHTDNILLHNCINPRFDALVSVHNCGAIRYQPALLLHSCTVSKTVGVVSLKPFCTAFNTGSKPVYNCNKTTIQKAIPVPCRHYKIEPTDPIDTDPTDPTDPTEPVTIEKKKVYIMKNTITATIGGIAVEPLSFSIKTDINSYCWQGSVEIPPKDFARIKNKLAVGRGNEPLISVTINGYDFVIIAEEQSRNRQFVGHSHSLGGRSVTARLGADYALAQGNNGSNGNDTGMLELDNYASQIIDEQLDGLSISVEHYDMIDWLVPANQYSIAEKTPIAVIADVAKAGGGFVASHPSQPTIDLRRKWKHYAWEMATATPDVVVPMDVIKQATDTKRNNQRFNTVTLTSNVDAGFVYRELQSRDMEAPVSDNPLYTHRDAIVETGVAILSDSGLHADYTITMPFTNKYNITLAKLGDIWQIDDTEGAWRGVVTGVAIDVKLENNAPAVWQTVNIDRYLDI